MIILYVTTDVPSCNTYEKYEMKRFKVNNIDFLNRTGCYV